ncbi:phosphatase PAP2 family protein [Microtetraspora sp. AC03309]|uniref:phosphatase PAP2 family protein n=1 Tax=Microtetraspora sp. AC03309 TaxID=2779376 RepID=UPI001E411B11|nr:phosphatase PAP2 family protein [Microtetraspora sp. AC03309]MCC5580375.1 phosphatase PAP2 family protein [Microtetraspora sp. AC03309]
MTIPVEAAESRARESRTARVVTEVLSPFHVVIPLPVVVGWHQTYPAATGFLWGLFAAVSGGVLPYGLVLWRVARGKANDRHITRREQRLVPLAISVALVLGGVVVLLLAGAPSTVLAVQGALLGMGVVMLPITRLWKISFHTAAVAGAAAILTVEFGPWAWICWPFAALVGWSRIMLRDHTPAQVVAGAVAGVAVCWPVYALIG